jgi:hypothetical protein
MISLNDNVTTGSKLVFDLVNESRRQSTNFQILSTAVPQNGELQILSSNDDFSTPHVTIPPLI